jgi:hypothetical protein
MTGKSWLNGDDMHALYVGLPSMGQACGLVALGIAVPELNAWSHARFWLAFDEYNGAGLALLAVGMVAALALSITSWSKAVPHPTLGKSCLGLGFLFMMALLGKCLGKQADVHAAGKKP